MPTEKEKAEKMIFVVETLDLLYGSNVIDNESYQAMYVASQDNVSDIPNEITDSYLDYIKKQAEEGNPMNKMRVDIELATALNHAEGQGEGGSNLSNKVASKTQGKQQGGDPKKTTKPTVRVPIVKKKE